MAIKTISLDLIRTDAGTQTRCVITPDRVEEYAESMLTGDKFPPVIVYHDGTTYWLADGFHRVLAANRNKYATIAADVRTGTKLDALRCGLESNHTHGLYRTNADKRHCIGLALENFPKLSDRALAEMCGVSNTAVGEVRHEMDALSEIDSSSRIGRDGKSRKAPMRKAAKLSEPPIEISRPEETPHIRSAAEELAEPEPSRNAMGLALLAVNCLRDIAPIDPERLSAFDFVCDWIAGNR